MAGARSGVGFRRTKVPPPHSAQRMAEDRPSFTGSVRIGWFGTGVLPMGNLSFDDRWCRLAGPAQPAAWIPRAEVRLVCRARTTLPVPTIVFESDSGDFDGVAFRTLRPDPVLAAFAKAGWPTSPDRDG